MPIRLRSRILLGLSASLLLSFGGLLWWVETGLRARLLALSQTDMERSARLVAEEVGHLPFSDSLADLLGGIVGLRVTLIDSAGRVRGDSEVPTARLPAVENHADRPEVRAALEGRVGVDRRPSETVSRSLQYVAVPHPEGVVRLARSSEEVDAHLLRARQAVLVAAALAFLLAYVASGAIRGALAVRLRRLRARVDSVPEEGGRGVSTGARGRPDVPAPRSPAATPLHGRRPRGARAAVGGELEALAASIGRMAERVSEGARRRESERRDWQEMCDGLDGGLVLLDGEGYVLRANDTFKAWAGRSDPAGERITTLFRAPELAEVVENGLSGREESREAALGERSVLVSARPHGDGALVVLRDLTRLRQLEGVRRDFVANVSHELKTPLTSIVGFAEAVAEAELPAERRQEFADRILANARRMRRLVEDLLDLARIESGRWEPSPEPVLLAEVARAAWGSLEPAARRGAVGLRVVTDAPAVHADPAAVRQILLNLFDNALRYAPRDTEVRVEATPERGWVRVAVSDSGPGISSAHLPRIFERFYRVDPARSRAAGGTGLGLAIVKHLVTAHGGEVGAASELGRGTRIWFTLPSLAPRPTSTEEADSGGLRTD